MSRSLGAVPPRYQAPEYAQRLHPARGLAFGWLGGLCLWGSGFFVGLWVAGVVR